MVLTLKLLESAEYGGFLQQVMASPEMCEQLVPCFNSVLILVLAVLN